MHDFSLLTEKNTIQYLSQLIGYQLKISLGKATLVPNKLSKVMGIINRLKYIYPEQALLFIYNSIFLFFSY